MQSQFLKHGLRSSGRRVPHMVCSALAFLHSCSKRCLEQRTSPCSRSSSCAGLSPAQAVEDEEGRAPWQEEGGEEERHDPAASYWHQTLRGICKSVDAAASLLHAATGSMDGLVLRANLARHDPEMPKAVIACQQLLQALEKIGVEVTPPAQHEDLVALCRQNHLGPRSLLACSTTKDIFPFQQLISPRGLMTPRVCRYGR